MKNSANENVALAAEDVLNIIHNKAGSVVSEAYQELWNPEVQAKIDEAIDRNRKADATFILEDVPSGTEVSVEQLDHEFRFGAHIFNFNQLGSDACNERYKDLYGSFFNSATIPFYWRTLEPDEAEPRFEGRFEDSAEFWNTVTDPKRQPHWRRPAPDPIVEFCEQKKIHLHGHTLVWGNEIWHNPLWMREKLPARFRRMVELVDGNMPIKAPLFDDLSIEQLERMMPEFTLELHKQMARRIYEIGLRYKGRLSSWDIVNESSTDFREGKMVPGAGLCKSWYGLMPGDYAFRAFKLAESIFPESLLLNINDYNMDEHYLAQVKSLLSRGCKVDAIGAQMHLFDPEVCRAIAMGESRKQCPAQVYEELNRLSEAGLPLHLSEITITSPDSSEYGQMVQAIIARNLYRLWFSLPMMSAISWWNVVDDCGAPGEPSYSGLFFRDMTPKASFHALNDLIHNEWKTKLELSALDDGSVRFRGFPGRYQVKWTDADGSERSAEFVLKSSAHA
ncbi:endo-1,4-beta-xylanase [Coraliomargarita parva]|uniref:endo-1,4-beta-xylanase n=1 Tax=Coraliomargarita parva TaxID=3014050 RepID=UPI0022B33522|nr:endo-1,4-beta-xylanase [Coraliomargarita parva]